MNMPTRELSSSKILAAIADVEVPTTAYWRASMRAARKRLGLTQDQLGRLVDLRQPTVSDIESGVLLSSRQVPAISVALGISLPAIEVEDEYDEPWMDVGRTLRALRKPAFLRWLRMIEAEVAELEGREDSVKGGGD